MTRNTRHFLTMGGIVVDLSTASKGQLLLQLRPLTTFDVATGILVWPAPWRHTGRRAHNKPEHAIWLIAYVLSYRLSKGFAVDQQHRCGATDRVIERVALVIGNSDYQDQPLPNAVEDAGRVADALRKRSFDVKPLLNATTAQIDDAITEFRSLVKKAKIALIYLAGHAVERHGVGYFLPIDFPFPVTPSRAKIYAASLSYFVEATEGAKARIVVLDACRNWPAAREDQIRIDDDLDMMAADERRWQNVLLSFSTRARMTASDGQEGYGSTFCNAFCHYLLDHSLSADECFRRISQNVLEAGPSRQQPWTYSSLARELSFSDLPRYSILQRHILPNPFRLVDGWCVPEKYSTGIYAGLGKQAWYVNLAGWKQVHYYHSANLVGAADLRSECILAGQGGELIRADTDSPPIIKLDTNSSFGLCTSPSRSGFTHYGQRTAIVCSIANGEICEACRVTTEFDIYCCLYLCEKQLWLAGENGTIAKVELSIKNPTPDIVLELGQHINEMAISPDRSRIFCACQSGLLVALGLSTLERTTLSNGRDRKTAASIRAALMHVADDYLIRDYIFQPAKLPPGVFQALKKHLRSSDIRACAHAPNHPILAAGTDDATLLLFDTRDGQIFQETDLSTGIPGAIAGLVFLSSTELVAVGAEGQVTFLAAA